MTESLRTPFSYWETARVRAGAVAEHLRRRTAHGHVVGGDDPFEPRLRREHGHALDAGEVRDDLVLARHRHARDVAHELVPGVDEDLDVTYIAKTSDTCYGDYTYVFRGEVEVEDKRKKYEIEFFDEAYDSIFECELDDDDELQCDDLEYDDRYEFERK